MKFEDTTLYKQGKFHKELGELMMNPDTTVTQVAEYGAKHGINVVITMQPVSAEEESSK